MRARFTTDHDSCAVSITAEDFLGDMETRTYRVPRSGGYVRDHRGNQVCAGLSSRGRTLYWSPGYGSFTDFIRREWRRYRRVKG